MVDDRKEVEIELTEEQFLWIAKQAHEEDITFNQMCKKILRWGIERLERGELTFKDEEKQGEGKESSSLQSGFVSPTD